MTAAIQRRPGPISPPVCSMPRSSIRVRGGLPIAPISRQLTPRCFKPSRPTPCSAIRGNGWAKSSSRKMRHNGRLTRPGKVHPARGSFPDVLALDQRARLLIKDGAAHIGDVFGAEVFDQLEGPAGIGDIVDD